VNSYGFALIELSESTLFIILSSEREVHGVILCRKGQSLGFGSVICSVNVHYTVL
jgi:hypothetical protein